MRVLIGIFLLLICFASHAKDWKFTVPVSNDPEVSILIIDRDEPTKVFEITNSGSVTWNTWEKGNKSDIPAKQKYQYENAEYEQTLKLAMQVFEKNYQSQESVSPSEPRVIYVIRVGEYFSSLVLNVSYHKGRALPSELQSLMAYVNELRQPNKSLKDAP